MCRELRQLSRLKAHSQLRLNAILRNPLPKISPHSDIIRGMGLASKCIENWRREFKSVHDCRAGT